MSVTSVLSAVGVLGIWAGSIVGCGAQAPPRRVEVNDAARAHISEVANSLPTESALRRRLEAGAHGDGVHRPWMDAMRREGVKRAFASTEFSLSGRRPVGDIKVGQTLYFSEYDGACSQISDPRALERIHTSGLDEDIGRAAQQRTMQGDVQVVDGPVTAQEGVGSLEFLADEWLPSLSFLSPAPEKPTNPFLHAVSTGDTARAMELLGRVGPGMRRAGIWRALAGDESCIVAALLARGVDANLRDQDGFTALMVAARLGAFQSAKTLLETGADPNATANFGKTALFFASQNDDLARLLRDHGAHE